MEINIAYGVNEKYTKYAYMSLLSILKNLKKGNSINCYLITTKNNGYSKYLKNLEKVFSNYKFHEVVVDEEKLKNIPTSLPHLDYSAFFRFSVDSLIKGVEKIIYIDADTIIKGDVSELFNTDLEGNIVGVISDQPDVYVTNIIDKLQLKNKKYFNSGVLLIDIKKWKDFEVSKKCLELLKKNRYPSDDQDPLNITLQDNCERLNGKFNVTRGYFLESEEDFRYIGFPRKYYLNATNNPTIIHFTGPVKARHLISIHPYTYVYDNTLLQAFKIPDNKGLINFKEVLIAIIHKIEFFILPKYNTRKKVRDLIFKFKKF